VRLIISKHRINRYIRVSKVRFIDADGNQRGVMPTEEAMKIAQEAGLDLVEVSPNTAPPVCKAMDYGRFLYHQQKEKKQPRAKALKEVVFRPVTGDADYQRKLKNVIEFLGKGHKVKVMIKLRGRERSTHDQIAGELVAKIASDVSAHTKAGSGESNKGGKERFKHYMVFDPKK